MTTFRQLKPRQGICSKPALCFFYISAASKGSVKLYTYHQVFSHPAKVVYKRERMVFWSGALYTKVGFDLKFLLSFYNCVLMEK